MLADVFLYGRTKTYDYFDMYIPEWMSADSDEYREYRKMVSFIMKIRDILPENKLYILEKTSGSFFFLYGRKISLLCRFCTTRGTDEFGRPVFFTEGFIFRNDDADEFWKYVPDFISKISCSEKMYFDEYTEVHGSEAKPQSESRTEEIIRGAYPFVNSGQFTEMKNAVSISRGPFSFAFGTFEKALYDYASPEDGVNISAFFVSDECTEFSADENSISDADCGGLVKYIMLTRTRQEKFKYKVVLCRDDETRMLNSIAYESYEKEAASEIKISEIFRMNASVNEYILRNGADEKSVRKCIPYSSESAAEYSGRNVTLVYSQPVSQKRSLLQIIKGDRGPDYTESMSLKSETEEMKLSDVSEIFAVYDDRESRLISFEKIMEVAD